MERQHPYVITVASEKGGVGKTTIATNLAVFIKALREDLPVTIASFDNHFSVDSMFAIGRHYGQSVAGLFGAIPAAELVQIGEYGVQFMASERALIPPDNDYGHLRRALSDSGLSGVLVLDTRPILDYFTLNALLASDLVLAPVKDRPSLVNIASIRQTMEDIGADPQRLWLVPSLIDKRLRLRGDLGVREFLVGQAEERDYQVVDTWIAKSPKVEGLTTNLSSKVYPVLTHARYTAVHYQFRSLAAFALGQYDHCHAPVACAWALEQARDVQMPAVRQRRLVQECPVCGAAVDGSEGHFFQDLRSRRIGFLHTPCLGNLTAGTDMATFLPVSGLMVAVRGDDGESEPAERVQLHLFDAYGDDIGNEGCPADVDSPWPAFFRAASGREAGELFHDAMVVSFQEGPPGQYLDREGYAEFGRLRRRALRSIREREGY